MERRKFFKKKYILSILTIVCLLCATLGFCFTSSASNRLEYISYFNEPQVTDYGGYINVMIGTYDDFEIETFVFDYGNYIVSNDSMCVTDIVLQEYQLLLHPYKADLSNFTAIRLSQGGFTQVLRTGVNEDPVIYNFSERVIGFSIQGRYGVLTTPDYSLYNPSIVWSGQFPTNELLDKVYEMLSYDEISVEKLNWILGSTMTIEQKLDELKELYRESLSWYERLFNLIKDLFEDSQDEELDDLTQDNDKVVEGTDKENEVMDSTTEREEENSYSEQDIEDLKEQGQIDAGGTWGVFDAICRVNPKVFSVILSVLSIAIIGLIFNR